MRRILSDISGFIRVTESIIFGIVGWYLFLDGFILRPDVHQVILGVCLLIYSDVVWLYYKDSVRSRKSEKQT